MQWMMSVGAHDQKAGPNGSDLLQQNVGGFQSRFHHVQLIRRLVRFKKLGSEFRRDLRFPVITPHTHQVNGLTTGQPEKLERLQRTRHLSSSSVCHNDTASGWQFSGHDHNWTRTAAENFRTNIIRLILRFEMEVCFAPEKNHVTAVCLLQNALGWIADIFKYLGRDSCCRAAFLKLGKETHHVFLSVSESRLVTLLLEGTSS
jgi:hypothetical protein